MNLNPTTNHSRLFSPAVLGTVSLKNRIVMAPLTRSRAADGNVPHELNARYYAQRASAGLIISEATQISPQGQGYPKTPGIYSHAQISGWRSVTNAVHDQGGKIFLQLWHVGRVSHPSTQENGNLPVAPSAIKPVGEIYTEQGMQPFVTPRALEISELPELIADFRQAAVNAKEAGFDGVEIHAANGYLIDQFLRDGTNQRDDAYGGSVENRARLLREVTEAVLTVWEPGRVGVRLSPVNPFNDMADSNPQVTFEAITEQLNAYGLAYLHVVEDRETNFDFQKLRHIFNGAYMANGGYERNSAIIAIDTDRADFIAFGKLFIANPDLPKRLRLGAEFNVPREASFYAGGPDGYDDYPSLDMPDADTN
ncbi:alkene reductase [Undibacterium sp. Jales W-56]|uniref:alkene reductase n=1 Tax=Undibacterium sp. Jales W-56 TaxID=2897325 RepID=UPI0021CEF17A|nr:alkene reductase [Undibacterium sp. Jales W-56]MCU6435178.1 alkene reductase [Undibacterium sp. Jales W-56]